MNGKNYTAHYFRQSDITNVCTLKFEMGSNPAKEKGLTAADKPFSLSAASK
ncbi:hypothetical protein ADIARSV_1003 [Arcticibacter svalbardensis MN12-7]|uniref:Uncharacterized protein n=1 Tax=Arcticibacter svalbardensis MN12-7 TaxID=1150600 RepID=R9GW07_9SPHI|nr:hypothetical protein [Arcticibacter svalbardensis]EOR95690.1 hypothetical protein ADIARSV_1003 [Arcticibacter svalbardensis MN12-7]